jgi:PAS domain S-box-containing protein
MRVEDVSFLKKDASGMVEHYLVGPIVSGGVTEGVMVVVAKSDDITRISQTSWFGETGETQIMTKVNGADALFLTPTRFDPSAALTRKVIAGTIDAASLHAIAGEESIFTNLVDYRNVKVFAATRHIASTGWSIVVKVDQSEALAPIRKLQELFAVIVLLVGLMIVIVGISISRSITNPLRELTLLANSISRGGVRQNIVITTMDEVGVLATAFNNMVFKLWKASDTLEENVLARTRELAEKTEEAKDSEKAALNIAEDLKNEEEKLSQEKLKAETLANDLLKFKLALDNASDQVIITDPEGMVVYVNSVIEKVTGYTPEEVVGKKAGALWKLPMQIEFYKNLWHVIKEEGKPFIGEVQNRRKNGEIYMAMISISPVTDKYGKVIFFVGIERDITKEKEIDKAKDEFISLASHQMRTPITAINWYTEMLLDGDAGALNAKQKNYFEEIYGASQKMGGIVKSFMHILRLETGSASFRPVTVDIAEIAKDAIKETQIVTGEKHLHVIEHYKEQLPQVISDEEFVRIILQNLISNAAKYSVDNGDLDVSLDIATDGCVVAGKTVREDSIIIIVRDTGIGISEGDKDKIFTKFFRSENAKRRDPNGNGIGLYMTKFMVDAIGGTIWFSSEEGKGTIFYVLIPLKPHKLV